MLKSHSVLVPLSFHCHSNVDGLVQASFQEKPLTDEEREAKAAEIRERLAAKRSQREKEEAQAQRAAEQRRREDGKVLGLTAKLPECAAPLVLDAALHLPITDSFLASNSHLSNPLLTCLSCI
eukprot:TRINITY_DN10669_c0_g3_i1.p2 TRINITY_DN10669_c0_g3~~TRINITY_DN10669_c0_g3_i1.p2  ORF type:complete len:123 (+),score=23.26 TRINITY_DN10669_c0_g3_i1:377-745(+)